MGRFTVKGGRLVKVESDQEVREEAKARIAKVSKSPQKRGHKGRGLNSGENLLNSPNKGVDEVKLIRTDRERETEGGWESDGSQGHSEEEFYQPQSPVLLQVDEVISEARGIDRKKERKGKEPAVTKCRKLEVSTEKVYTESEVKVLIEKSEEKQQEIVLKVLNELSELRKKLDGRDSSDSRRSSSRRRSRRRGSRKSRSGSSRSRSSSTHRRGGTSKRAESDKFVEDTGRKGESKVACENVVEEQPTKHC